MRCACPACGGLMPQAASEPRCVCPVCGYTCAACLGVGNGPLSLEDIRKLGDVLTEPKEGRER